MRCAWLAFVVLLSVQAAVVSSASLHDDEAVSARHSVSKRHIQPILNQINRLLGTKTLSTSVAPETVAPELAPPVQAVPAEVSPAVVLRSESSAVEVPPTGLSDGSATQAFTMPVARPSEPATAASNAANVIAANDASPPQEQLNVSGESAEEGQHRSKRSFEPLLTIDKLAHYPHHKLEELLRSLPGGKFVVEDHYNASAPKPIQELNEVLFSAVKPKKTISINKKVELKLPTKTITKEVTIEKNGLSQLVERIKTALKNLVKEVPVTPPAPPVLPPKAVPPPVAPPVLPPLTIEKSVTKEVKVGLPVPEAAVTTPAPPILVVVTKEPAPAPPPVLPPAVLVPTVVVPPTEALVTLPTTPPPTTTAAPLIEASVSKTVKIPVDDAKPEEATS